MPQENIVVVKFTEPGKAQEGLRVLKECSTDERVVLKSAAVVERLDDGDLRTVDSWDNLGPVGMGSGSLIGALIGVLAGPTGALVGFGTGAAMGGAFDVDHAVTSKETLNVLGEAIPTGSTALIADVEEYAVEVVDVEMKKLDGAVTRRPVSEVMDEVGAVEDAADAAARKKHRAAREQRMAELHADVHERVAEAKDKLHHT